MIASIKRNNSLPPSSAGKGNRFIIPRLTDKRSAMLTILSTTVATPYCLVSSIVVSITWATPTGPARSSFLSLPVKSIFSDLNVTLSQYLTSSAEYLNTLKQYNVNLTSLDFNSKESDNIINNNLYNRTKNQITRAISDSNLTDESLVSINSLYFNYKWDNIFNSENIIDEEFTDINDKHYMVDMMYSEETIYLENSFATGFIKDFEGEKYSFVGILPKEKGEYKLSEINIQSLIESKKEVKTFIGLPKFSINSLNNLTELYNSYGIKEIFYSGANLHQMSTRNLYVAKMIQKEKITIGEYGTEEGKTKTESLSTSIIEDNTKKVILNRPFAFLIIDKETNEVLLIGKYNNPN